MPTPTHLRVERARWTRPEGKIKQANPLCHDGWAGSLEAVVPITNIAAFGNFVDMPKPTYAAHQGQVH